jgi:CubicO group peptidase (beta-lactamase class C family)
MKSGEVLHDSCIGMMDVERCRPWQADAIVRIYSMTKPIVSTALMMQIERGLARLDQPVSDFLPGWLDQRVWTGGEGPELSTEAAARPVTLRHLLTHTAGLTYGTKLASLGGAKVEDPVALLYPQTDAAATCSLQAYARAVGRLPLRFQPGTRWMYSVATDIVGAVVEAIAERPLGKHLAEVIFSPLGMEDTGFHAPKDAAHRLAACYIATPEEPMRLADDPATSRFLVAPTFESGGGGLVSTMDDYGRFAEFLRKGGAPLLLASSVETMITNQLPGGRELKYLALVSDPRLLRDTTGFGLGFATTLDAARTGMPATSDFYWSGAATTIWWVDRGRDLTVLFMTQLLPATAYGFQDWLKRHVYAALD